MRDYQREYKNPYWMRNTLYYEILWIIRGYEDLKKEYNDRIEEGMSPGTESSGGKTNQTGDPTGMKAIKLTVISEQIRAIEKARLVIPFQYMEGMKDLTGRTVMVLGRKFNLTSQDPEFGLLSKPVCSIFNCGKAIEYLSSLV